MEANKELAKTEYRDLGLSMKQLINQSKSEESFRKLFSVNDMDIEWEMAWWKRLVIFVGKYWRITKKNP